MDMIPEDPRDPLARDEVDEALRYLLHLFTQSRLVEADLNATLKALVETLVSSGVIPPEKFERNRQRALDAATARLAERPIIKIERTLDKYVLDDLPDIDCAAIMPICKARCCKLTVCLSRQDLDEKEILWDYGKPYQIRKREDDGYCWHNDPKTQGCGVYQRRPAICRSYDCRTDIRIWKDFENRILADSNV